VVHGSGDCGVEGRATRHAWRPTAVLGVGDHHGADAAGGFPPSATPDRRADASHLRLLGLDLAVPDHSTISRRGETLPVSRPRPGSGPVHLLVDSTGLKLCGPGEWLVEKHAAKVRRSWRQLHIGVDADTGEIIAAELTGKDVDAARRSVPCWSRLRARLRRLPAMGHTIGTMSTVRSASVIRMRRSLCRHVRARCQAQRQRPRRPSATGICS
jgi:hypothetical protein